MFTAIAEYARLFNVEDFDEFLYIIRSMDNEYLKVSSKEEASGKNNSSHKNNR